MIAVDSASKPFLLQTQGAAWLPVPGNTRLHVMAGECVALTGVSGSGKSVCMRFVCGHHSATSGTVRFEDVHVASGALRKVLALNRKVSGMARPPHVPIAPVAPLSRKFAVRRLCAVRQVCGPAIPTFPDLRGL